MDILGDDTGGAGEPDRQKLAASLKKLESYLVELRQERVTAERALDAQSEFVTTICHEVRTQLGAVFAFSDLLLATDLDETQSDYADQLKHCAGELLNLMNNVLDHAKLSEGKLELAKIPFSFSKMLESFGRTLDVRCAAKGLETNMTVTGELPDMALGDEARIRQVLMNFADNAVKFTEEGAISLHVERLASDDKRARVRFSVRDTGVGFDQQMREQLFSAYEQGDESTAVTYGGTGLGLSIATKLVEMMGGKIGCDSVLGEGSIFWFTTLVEPVEEEPHFAAQNDDAPAEATAQPAGPDAGAADDIAVEDDGLFEAGDELAAPLTPPQRPQTQGPAHILVVEDNRVNQMLVTTYLTKFGHTFSVVDNGFDAIEAVQRHYYDLILMDVHMPEIDGLETTAEIRKLGGRWATMPIIAVTANVLHARRQTYLAAGMNACLTKPIDAMQMLNTITKHLQIERSATAELPERADNDDADLFEDTVEFV
jgi:signal transduction histidine kinase/CheY-like chemotaxis protein